MRQPLTPHRKEGHREKVEVRLASEHVRNSSRACADNRGNGHGTRPERSTKDEREQPAIHPNSLLHEPAGSIVGERTLKTHPHAKKD